MYDRIVYFVDEIETSFVINDIRRISQKFKSVILFSIDEVEKKDLLPSNVILIEEFMDWKNFNKGRLLFENLFSILSIYINECWALRKLLPFKRSIAVIGSNIFKAKEVKRNLDQMNLKLTEMDLFYSFWFYDCIYLSWLKKHHPKIKVVTRTHSGDLYEDHISIRNKLLFRHFQFKYLDAVYPVSDMGTDYLKKQYPEYANKLSTVFLGTADYNCLNPFNQKEIVMVSCASFRHHKRIHKIANALLFVKSNVTWYHFGNENLHTKDPKIPEYIEMKRQLLTKPNIKYYPMGFKENEELMEFYKINPVSFFISLSAAEGIPISIMEAISFGIPVLSTDVGGCSEIVNDETGKLIPLKTDLEEIANWIDAFSESRMNTEEYRENVRKFWKRKYRFDDNYKSLFVHLESLQS